MVKENFNTLGELYRHVLPALKSKVKELKSLNITSITERDIWNCLKNTKWYQESDLTLFDIVNDILFIEDKILINYLNSTNRLKDEIREENEIKKTEKNSELESDTIL